MTMDEFYQLVESRWIQFYQRGITQGVVVCDSNFMRPKYRALTVFQGAVYMDEEYATLDAARMAIEKALA